MGIDSGYGIGSLKTGVCTSTTRPASPFEGQTIYETDTDLTKAYNGASWVNVGATAGAVTLVETLSPSAAATASFTTGKISSSYTYYTVFYSLDKTFVTNLRSAGSTITASNYNSQVLGATTGAVNVNSTQSSRPSWENNLGVLPNPNANFFHVFNYAGSAAQFPTLVTPMTYLQWSGATYASLTGNWQYGTTQAFDSLIFTPNSGTFSGTIKLYGWS